MTDKHFVFVGGTSGIGKTAALSLAARGARVLVLGRDAERAQRTVQQLREAGATSAEALQADLLSRASIAAAVRGIRARSPSISGLVHSAMTVDLHARRRQETADGFELAYGLQYFARAALNVALFDALAASGDGRIVHVGAKPPTGLVPDLDDLQFERRRWTLMRALMSSQVLGFLHVQEAARRWSGAPVRIAIACVGPTVTDTIARQPWWARALYAMIATTPERSAANVVRYLTEPDVSSQSGVAFESPKRWEARRIAYDPVLAERVWELTTAHLPAQPS
ncbi:Putative oxidoreductase/Short-chain dehydrogenase [Minicystis rosea]|nr:Putative oxidoreductase/Short-chain dehydrogenase [Minicystis rosea]